MKKPSCKEEGLNGYHDYKINKNTTPETSVTNVRVTPYAHSSCALPFSFTTGLIGITEATKKATNITTAVNNNATINRITS